MRSWLVCSLWLFVLAFNVNASDIKIGFIDSREVESKSLIIKDISKKVEAQTKKIQVSIAEKEKSLQKEVQELEKKRSVLSESALQEKQQALQQKVMEWQEGIKRDGDAVERAKLECLGQVDDKAKSIVEKISKDKKVDLVFSSQGLLYSNPDSVQDLTKDFIDELNNKIKASDFDELYKKFASSKK